MASFSVKGNDFFIHDRFEENHLPSPGQAQAINRYIAGSLKVEIISKRITTRAEAFAYIMGDKCLAPRGSTQQDIDPLEGL